MRFFFLGERLAVDLLNTVVVQDGRGQDLLQGPRDVAAWAEAAGVLPPRGLGGAARLFLDAAVRGPGKGRPFLAAAPAGRPPCYRQPVDSPRSTETARSSRSASRRISWFDICVRSGPHRVEGGGRCERVPQ